MEIKIIQKMSFIKYIFRYIFGIDSLRFTTFINTHINIPFIIKRVNEPVDQ